MITIINDAPENVAAFRATGAVNKEDYKRVVIPAIDALVKNQGKINFMLVLDTALTNFSIGAFLQDLGVGLKHFTKWIGWRSFRSRALLINFQTYLAISPQVKRRDLPMLSLRRLNNGLVLIK